MKLSTALSTALLAGAGSAKPVKIDRDTNLRIISYNIRAAKAELSTGEPAWAVRRPLLAEQIESETATRPESLVCLQEVAPQQLLDIKEDLGETWTHVGVGRVNGADKGEFAPILYQPATWEMTKNRTYWLSETPDVPGSKGWDTAVVRIANVAQFSHVQTGAQLVYICTHWDHKGTVARLESAKMMVNISNEWSESDTIPVFLGGDLNAEPDEDSYAELIADGGFYDAIDLVAPENKFGPYETFTGFTNSTSGDKRLDYVFSNQEAQGLEFQTHTVSPNQKEGVWISDHRSVVVDAVLRG